MKAPSAEPTEGFVSEGEDTRRRSDYSASMRSTPRFAGIGTRSLGDDWEPAITSLTLGRPRR